MGQHNRGGEDFHGFHRSIEGGAFVLFRALFGGAANSPGGIFVAIIVIVGLLYILLEPLIIRSLIWLSNITDFIFQTEIYWGIAAAFLLGAALRKPNTADGALGIFSIGYLAAASIACLTLGSEFAGGGTAPALVLFLGYVASFMAVAKADTVPLRWSLLTILCGILLAVLSPQLFWMGSVGAWAAIGLGGWLVEMASGGWKAAPARRIAASWLTCLAGGLVLGWIGVTPVKATDATVAASPVAQHPGPTSHRTTIHHGHSHKS